MAGDVGFMFTGESLKRDLIRAGICPGDTILVHSSMKRIGEVEGGADTVLDVLCNFVGDAGGLVVFPTLSYTLACFEEPGSERCTECERQFKASYCLARGYLHREDIRVFDVNRTPAVTGILPELFRRRSGVVRSLNPTHSLAAFGRDAASFVAGHEDGDSACGMTTPWRKLFERSAKMLMLGAQVGNTTFLHAVTEWFFGTETVRFYPCLFELHGYEGKLPAPVKRRVSAGNSSHFSILEPTLESSGALSRFRFGAADSLLMDCRGVAAVAEAALRENPRIW